MISMLSHLHVERLFVYLFNRYTQWKRVSVISKFKQIFLFLSQVWLRKSRCTVIGYHSCRYQTGEDRE